MLEVITATIDSRGLLTLNTEEWTPEDEKKITDRLSREKIRWIYSDIDHIDISIKDTLRAIIELSMSYDVLIK